MKTKKLVFSALIGAIYVVLTVVMGEFGYGIVQFRPSEALTVLPFLFPETMWGLFVGCALSNMFSQFGIIDIIFGSLATLTAAYLTSKCKNIWTAVIPPIIINAVVVGALIVIGTPEMGFISWPANAGFIFVEETLSVIGLGVPLYFILRSLKLMQRDA